MGIEKSTITVDTIMSMRTKELRNILIQTFGLQREEVLKIIDRGQLRELALEKFVAMKSSDQYHEYLYRIGATIMAIIVSLIILLNYNVIYKFFKGLTKRKMWKYFKTSFYKQVKRYKMAKFSWKEGAYLACITFILATIFEVYNTLVQISTLLSWIIPSSYIHYYRLRPPVVLSFPVSTSMLLPKNSSSGNSNDSSGGFGVDMGPMITSWILMWLVNRLDSIGAEGMNAVMIAKDQSTWNSGSKSSRQCDNNHDHGDDRDHDIDAKNIETKNEFRTYDGIPISASVMDENGEEKLTEEELHFIHS